MVPPYTINLENKVFKSHEKVYLILNNIFPSVVKHATNGNLNKIMIFTLLSTSFICIFLISTLTNVFPVSFLNDKKLGEMLKQSYTLNNNSQVMVGNLPSDIDFNEVTNTIYVSNSGSNTISVIRGMDNKKIVDIPVGDRPLGVSVNEVTNTIYVSNFGSNNITVISGATNTKITEIPVSYDPNDVSVNEVTNTIYVSNSGSNTISVISGINNTKIEDIPVGVGPVSIGVNENTNTIYVSNMGSNTISVIRGMDNKKIVDIPVGEDPRGIGVNRFTNLIYVANMGSKSVSLVSGANNTKIEDIPVGEGPTAVGVNHVAMAVYTANFGSNSLSLIDAIDNKIVAGIFLHVKPFNSGVIECDESIAPNGEYFYVNSGTVCRAKSNQGFEFLSWEENIMNNSTQIINVSQPASTLESIKNFFNIKSEDPKAKLKVTTFGTFTANFKELPPALPKEYWATLFGVVVTAFISSWLTPTIIGWRKAKKHQGKLNDYQNELKDLYKDNKFDKSDIDNLDVLRDKVISGYTIGDITKEQYDVLLNNISTRYNEIFQNEINLLKNTNNNDEKIKLSNKIQSDLNDAYLKKKIDKEHYDLLKEMVSEFEDKQ